MATPKFKIIKLIPFSWGDFEVKSPNPILAKVVSAKYQYLTKTSEFWSSRVEISRTGLLVLL